MCNEDDAFLNRMLDAADPNVLRLALYQLTGNSKLAAMRTEQVPIWAGALYTYSLDAAHHAEVKRLALDFLRHRSTVSSPDISRQRVRETMELFGHGSLSEDEFSLGYEEAAVDEFPRDISWTRQPSESTLREIHVVVIGAGISGIAAGVQLKRLGIPFTVIERQSELGGTWNLNNYPEARVDSTSLIYQYKFEKRYPWKEYFAARDDTKQYLEHCASKYGVSSHIEFDSEVVEAVWNEMKAKWQLSVRSRKHETRVIVANFIISASGLFSTPKLPDIPGIGAFEGKIFHTTAWDHDFELSGSLVALIGTGATGVQLMPHLAKHAKSLTIFQRTPNWIFPMEGYKACLPAEMPWLFEHFPYYWNWFSYGMYYLNAQLEGLQMGDTEWQKSGGAISRRNDQLRANVERHIRTIFALRPELIEKTLPRYPPMARRPTIDNGWYDALLRDSVELVTDPIGHFERKGIRLTAGKLYEFDLVVCAAGFATTRYFWPVKYVGRNGALVSELWQPEGPRAYLGLTMPGFPNLFTFYGPNSQGRSGSFYSLAEMWTRYVLKAITQVIESGKSSIECRREGYDRYNRELDAASSRLLWQTYGKGFYYVNEHGRSVVNSPWSMPEYRARLFEPDLEDFLIH